MMNIVCKFLNQILPYYEQENRALKYSRISQDVSFRKNFIFGQYKSTLPELKDRERECLFWARYGKSASETSEILGLKRATVKNYLEGVREKFQVSSIQECNNTSTTISNYLMSYYMENKKKRVIVASIGTFLEWAEFTYFAYIANIIARLFFPELSSRLGLIATFSVFAVGYFFRPLGSLYFGYLGDKLGRRIALQASIMLMGISSLLIGCLPTYNSIGILAPILLVFLRCTQGFSVSGEFNGSAIYLIEHDQERPCQAGSWTGFASALGMMFGGLMSTLISLHQMPVWAWRIPFLLGTLSCFCGIYFRRSLSESPAYLKIQKGKKSNPLKIVFKHYKKDLVKAALLVTALGIYIYIMNVYYASHLVKYTTLQAIDTKFIVTLAQGLVVLFIFVIGMLADRMNEQFIIKLGLAGFFIAAPLAYLAPLTNSFLFILLSQIPYALCNALVGVPIFKLLNDFFPTHIRYSGVSIAWGVSMAIFGGTAPLVANYLQYLFNLSFAPVFYILLSAGIALLVLQNEKRYKFAPIKLELR